MRVEFVNGTKRKKINVHLKEEGESPTPHSHIRTHMYMENKHAKQLK